jgi:hypothetical protein
LGNIVGPVQNCLVGFHVGRYFVKCWIYFSIFKLPSAHLFFGWETLSQGRGWCESFPRNGCCIFRLCLYRMDLVWIRRSRSSNLRGCRGNFRNHPVRIPCDRRHRMSPYLGVENFRSQLLVTRCIRNAVLDRCPHIPSFVPRSLGPFRCYCCHPLGLALVVSYWLR